MMSKVFLIDVKYRLRRLLNYLFLFSELLPAQLVVLSFLIFHHVKQTTRPLETVQKKSFHLHAAAYQYAN